MNDKIFTLQLKYSKYIKKIIYCEIIKTEWSLIKTNGSKVLKKSFVLVEWGYETKKNHIGKIYFRFIYT